jgi:hypothetical protein
MSKTRRSGTRLLWWFTISGAVVPWMAGIGTKMYLDHLGRPTFPWSGFLGLETIVIEILFSVWFTSPFFALGLFARHRLTAVSGSKDLYRARLIPIISGFGLGLIGELIVFVGVFWSFDILMFFTPLPVFYALFIVIGWAAGNGLVSFFNRRRTRGLMTER